MTQSTETATTLRETLHFVGGEWVASSDGATFDVADPFTGEPVVRAAAGNARRRATRGRGRCGGIPRVGCDAARRPPGHLPPRRRHPREPPRRGRRPAGPRDRLHVRLRHVPDVLHARACCARRPGSAYGADRRGDPVRRPGSDGDGPAAAGRRRRRDRAVERRADPLAALDHGAARARQHRRAEAVGVVAGLRRHALGRDLRRGGPAGRSPEHRHACARRGGRDRRRARREPGRAATQLHRLDADGPAPGRGVRPPAEARGARARRLEPADRAR